MAHQIGVITIPAEAFGSPGSAGTWKYVDTDAVTYSFQDPVILLTVSVANTKNSPPLTVAIAEFDGEQFRARVFYPADTPPDGFVEVHYRVQDAAA